MAASTYAKNTSLVKPADIIKIDAGRASAGWYIPAPTVQELIRRRDYLKAWYRPRDFMFRKYIAMARLEVPFSNAKSDLANRDMHLKKDAQNKYTISTAPFDALTLNIAMVSDRHPYVTCYPTHKGHTDARMGEFDRFTQGAIDTCSKQSDFMVDMVSKLSVTGWLPTMTVFDPAKQKQGVFPFDLQILDPLNFYPQLDGQRRPIYAFVEHHLNGAQLLQNYSMFAGVAEIFEAEEPPGESNDAEYKNYCLEGNNLLTTEFDVSEYYDDTYRAILIGCGDASTTACRYNPALKSLKAKSDKGGMASVMHGSDHEDNPYCGIEEHHLGCIPVNLEGCWPEPVSPIARETSGLSSGSASQYSTGNWGRFVYLPFLYSMYNNWVDQCKLRDMIYRAVEELTDPQIIVLSENTAKFQQVKDQKVVMLGDGEKYEKEPPRPIGAEMMSLIQYMDQEMKNSAFAGSAYGLRGGSSARQQEASFSAGTVRENQVIRGVERSIAQYPKQITHALIERGGDESVFVFGNGTKWGEDGYTRTYSAKDLQGVVPEIEVHLKAKNGLKDPANVMAYTSLKGTKDFDTGFLMRTVLDIVNPDKILADAKKEMISADVSVLKPQVEVAALAASEQELQTKWKLQEKIQLTTDQHQHDLDMKQVELDMSQLSEEKHAAVERATIQKILAEAQGQDPNGGVPGAGPMNALPPPMQPMSSSPQGMPPNLHLPTTPSIGAGLPSPAGPTQIPGNGFPMPMMQPRPQMPAPPPQMIQRPPLPLPARPMGPVSGPPAVRPVSSGLPGDFAKGPGQRNRIQPLSAYQPKGGIGRPGVPPGLMSGAGLHGTPMDTPKIEAVNAAFRPLTLDAAVRRKRKRGSRGK